MSAGEMDLHLRKLLCAQRGQFASGLVLAVLLCGPVLGQAAGPEAQQVRNLNNDLLRYHAEAQRLPPDALTALRGEVATVMAQRAAALSRLVQEDPAQALALAFSPELLATLAKAFPEAAPLLESHGTWQGPSEEWIFDSVDMKSSRSVTHMKVGARDIEVHFASSEPNGLKCGDLLQATGVLVGNQMTVSSSTALATTTTSICGTTGVQNTAVLLVTFPGVTPPSNITPQSVHDMFFATTGASLDGYWREVSYGQTSAAGNVFGWYTLDSSYANCARLDLLRDAAVAAATNAGVNFQNYQRIFIVTTDFGCGWSGLAINGCTSLTSPTGSFTASASFLDASWQRSQTEGAQTAAHEGGHNMGLAHAQSRTFGTEALGPLGAAGTLAEYGDLLSNMGSMNIGHYAMPHKAEILNWIASPANYQVVQSSGTWTLQPAEISPAGLVALKVQRGTGNAAWLWVEYRQPIGIYDSTIWPTSGALIHYEDSTTGSHTQLLDFTPATASVYDSPLMPGNTWVDPYTNVSVSVLSATASALTVSVNYGTAPCTQAIPTLSLSPLNPSLSAGSSTIYTLAVTDNDSSGCAAVSFALASSQPSGWTSSFSASSLTLNPGQTGTVTMTVAVPAGTTSATYSLGASAANATLVGSGSANCTVVASTSTLTDSLSLSASSYKARQTVSMTSTVMSGSTPAAGALVTFTITKANGSQATGQGTTDSTGKASWSYKLGPKDPTGSYSAVTVAASGSQTATSNSVNFSVQ